MKKIESNLPYQPLSSKLLALAVIALAGALLSPFLAIAQPTTAIEDRSNVDTASYIIFKDNGKIYAKNGMTGKIEFTGTDFSTIINDTINAVGSLPAIGGEIYIKEGTYSVKSTITIPKSWLIIVGSGRGTILSLANNANQDMFHLGRADTYINNIQIRDIALDGNKTHNTLGNGIYNYGTDFATFERVRIANFAESGIQNTGSKNSAKPGYKSCGTRMLRCNLGNNDIGVFENQVSYSTQIVGCEIDNNRIGVYMNWVMESLIANNFMNANTQAAIQSLFSGHFRIIGNIIEDHPQKAIFIQNTTSAASPTPNGQGCISINGNTILRCSKSSPGTYDGITIQADNGQKAQNINITGNTIDGTISSPPKIGMRYGISEINVGTGICDYNLFANNTIIHYLAGAISQSGQNSIVGPNIQRQSL